MLQVRAGKQSRQAAIQHVAKSLSAKHGVTNGHVLGFVVPHMLRYIKANFLAKSLNNVPCHISFELGAM